MKKFLIGFLFIKVLQILLSVTNHCVQVSLVLDCQVKSSVDTIENEIKKDWCKCQVIFIALSENLKKDLWNNGS